MFSAAYSFVRILGSVMLADFYKPEISPLWHCTLTVATRRDLIPRPPSHANQICTILRDYYNPISGTCVTALDSRSCRV